jgi:acyl-CoA thioesterase FadM
MSTLASARALLIAPAEAQSLDLEVRSYETDASGRVTMGTVLRYLEHVATRASDELGFSAQWYEAAGTAWVVRDLRVLPGRMPGIGHPLTLSTWVSTSGMVQANREYLICDKRSGRPVARAQARWAYVDRVSGQPRRISPELVERLPVLGHALPKAEALPDDLGAVASATGLLEVTPRGYEADVQQHTNNAVYADWLDEALRLATGAAGLNFATLRPRETRMTYLSPVHTGERVTIHTTLRRPRPHCLVAQQSIRRVPGSDEVLRATTTVRVSAT